MEQVKINNNAESRLVVITAFSGASLINIAGPADVFAYASKIIGERYGIKNAYEVVLSSYNGETVLTTASGIKLVSAGAVMDINRPIDTLVISSLTPALRNVAKDKFYDWIASAYPNIRRVCSVCLGALALGRAGLLKNRRATTHWHYCKRMQAELTDTRVDYGPFYVKDGNIYTSGGVSSGIDLALALVEEDYGREIALAAARQLVIYLKRPGSQAQFGELPPMTDDGEGLINKLGPWMMDNLNGDLSVERLAEETAMSPRNFARVFTRQTGETPAKFVEKMRVEAARKMLEDTDVSIEQIADDCGLGGLVSMRRVFLRRLNLTPSDYRRMFKTSLAG
jgi:transcriptional regulator GlxA family with amidase domain